MNELKPIKLIPTFKDYIWGGNRLVNEYNKSCDMERVAESFFDINAETKLVL